MEEEETSDVNDVFLNHFGPSPSCLSTDTRSKADTGSWAITETRGAPFGGASTIQLSIDSSASGASNVPLAKLVCDFRSYHYLGTDSISSSRRGSSLSAPTRAIQLHPVFVALLALQLQLNADSLSDLRGFRSSLLECALKVNDIYLPHIRLHEHETARRALSLVLLNHILK